MRPPPRPRDARMQRVTSRALSSHGARTSAVTPRQDTSTSKHGPQQGACLQTQVNAHTSVAAGCRQQQAEVGPARRAPTTSCKEPMLGDSLGSALPRSNSRKVGSDRWAGVGLQVGPGTHRGARVATRKPNNCIMSFKVLCIDLKTCIIIRFYYDTNNINNAPRM